MTTAQPSAQNHGQSFTAPLQEGASAAPESAETSWAPWNGWWPGAPSSPEAAPHASSSTALGSSGQEDTQANDSKAESVGGSTSSQLQVPVQHEKDEAGTSGSRELTPREIIQQQDSEYQESELIDAKRGLDSQVGFYQTEVDKKERELEEAEDALRNAAGRLERYGSNPKVEQERDAAQEKVAEATQRLAEARQQLEKFSGASSELEAELVALRTERQTDEYEF
jgi:chromosome segregation ATPase